MSEPPETDPAAPTAAPPPPADEAYRVLARKYRPADFTTLIGQEALVRTLSNAIRTGRLAQAYVLTGVRGVGKTTTARIIARCLNCIGADGHGGPTVAPCGVCEHCRAIAEDRHVDVIEMDAASRTGVGDMRELLEGVRYRPTSARYKIYIIDEVHMLSTAAFNALLKTLEEPPEHVKFIFATTEIRKVPVTVLSRCQRFDLRRVTSEALAAHFRRIAEAERARVDDGALTLLARAADGSVRDGLSLLDQAIAHCAAAAGDGTVGEGEVRDMLGLADRGRVFDLLDAVMKGEVAAALRLLGDQYVAGADPVVVLGDMLDLTHWLTRLKVTPGAADDPMIAESERLRGRAMAEALSMGVLTRTWQMLLKGVAEARAAGVPLQAVEMCLIRLAYAADLPTPAEALARLQAGGSGGPSPSPSPSPPSPTPPTPPTPSSPPDPPPHDEPPPHDGPPDPPPHAGPDALRPAPPPSGSATGGGGGGGGGPQAQRAEAPPWDQPPPAATAALAPAPGPAASGGGFRRLPDDFAQMVAVLREGKEPRLAYHLERDIHLVHYAPPRLEFRPGPKAPADLAGRLQKRLGDWTGDRWAVVVSSQPGAPTLYETTLTGAQAHPLVQAVLAAFPNASIGAVRDLTGGIGEASGDPAALPDPDWETGDPDDPLGDPDP
jgi:DNA polymerase-3 subunit gamma/tau